ncbi:hypothetical protein MR810_02050 [bacterium]|nr:hypothetical protein [bacterium]
MQKKQKRDRTNHFQYAALWGIIINITIVITIVVLSECAQNSADSLKTEPKTALSFPAGQLAPPCLYFYFKPERCVFEPILLYFALKVYSGYRFKKQRKEHCLHK